MEAVVPAIALIGIVAYTLVAIPDVLTGAGLDRYLRDLGTFGLLCIGMALSLISGGIDLSIGSAYALSAIFSLIAVKLIALPVALGLIVVLAVGALMGSINGLLIAKFKALPFLVTLVTLVVFRGVVNLLDVRYGTDLAVADIENPFWTFIGQGEVLGLPTSVVVLIIVALCGHAIMSRSRYGWRVTAVGGNRRAARHAGVNVEAVVCSVYVVSGMLAALSGTMFAARLDAAGTRTGEGLEFLVLAAVIVGGVSLFGGRGTLLRALVGAILVGLLARSLLLQGYGASVQNVVLGVVLIASVALDAKFTKHRYRTIKRLYLSPVARTYPPSPPLEGAYEPNHRLEDAVPIGLDQIEGPEDVIVDAEGRVYAGTREGEIVRFSGQGYEDREVFARIGGRPVGLAIDGAGNIINCVCGMGLYRISPAGESELLTDTTRRTFLKLSDDSRIRVADDVDVAPDGRIFFSDLSTRFDAEDWILDCLEGRHNGRLLCYDPKTDKTQVILNKLLGPNGVAICHDGESLLVNQTWGCNVLRYWFAGPRRGELSEFARFPGYPDNVNRASDGGYWVALAGMRSPAFELMMANPRVRRRMVKNLPSQEWLYPSMNAGCVVKLTDTGEAVLSLWDPEGQSHAVVTSMREADGHLFLGGLQNNRIGRLRLTPEELTAAKSTTMTTGEDGDGGEEERRAAVAP